MKKAIVLLLALAVFGGAVFAQVTTAISFSGTVTLFDQESQGVFGQDGDGYDLLTFKGATEDGLIGFSMTDSDLFTGDFVLRDWNVYYKLFDSKVRVMIGKLRNADVRMILPNWNTNVFGGTERISGYGLLTSVYPVDGLTLELNLPYDTTVMDTADVFQMADFGAKYVIADVGTIIFLANLDLVAETNKVNFGFTYSGMENLTATLVYKGIFATDTEHLFAVGAAYEMGALSVGLEFAGDYVTEELYFDVAANADYTISDALSAGLLALYFSDEVFYALPATIDISAYIDYMLADGLDAVLTVGYTDEVYYSVDMVWSVAF